MIEKIKIVYCVAWNYKPRAVGLAAKIKDEFGFDSELVPGDKGIFDVYAPDGKLIFSKYSVGRFPETEDIFEKLQ